MKKFFISMLLLIISFCSLGEDKELDKYLPNKGKDVVKHLYYDVKFDDFTKCPDFVIYRMTDKNIVHKSKRDGRRFVKDSEIQNSANPVNYYRTGKDMGHMCPADDMSFSDEAMQETFKTSNACPQFPDFNRGIWKELENKVRKWNKEGRELIVVVGPIFIGGYAHETIGKENVFVPQCFFKIIYDEKNGEMLGFVFPADTAPNGKLEDFICEVNKIEKLKKTNFFKGIKHERKLENGISGFGMNKQRSKDNEGLPFAFP